MKKILFLLILLNLASLDALCQKVDLYFGLSNNSNEQCKFGSVEGCRIFKVPVTLYRNPSTGLMDSIALDKNNFIELLPNEVRGAQPNLNSDNTYVTFLCAKDTAGYFSKHIYIHKLGTGTVIDISQGQSLITGTFPEWLSDSAIIYNSPNYCVPASNPGCEPGSRYNDLTKKQTDLKSVTSYTRVWGDVHPSTLLDSKFCSFEDPVASPTNKNLIAFHSDPVIGGSTYSSIPIDCPFTYGLPTSISSLGAEPQPIVVKMDAAGASNLVKDLIPSVDYWKFDLAGAGINGLAHLDWHSNGTIIGTEQGSITSFRTCSNPAYGDNTSACVSNGGHMIPYDRPFGFELDNGMYRNIYRKTDPKQPLFDAIHPAKLPKSNLFWNPAIQICNSYRAAKQIQFCGSPKTIIATVFCKDNSSAIHFSRMYIIDFTDIHNPFYFDVTGWVEDNFPGRWANGQATAYSATCYITNTSTTDAPEQPALDDNTITLYPNPTPGRITVNPALTQGLSIKVFNTLGERIHAAWRENEIDMSNEPSGLYYIVISSQSGVIVKKIIKF